MISTDCNAASLQVENTIARPGDSITVRISVDQPAEIAAAVFALSYNTDYFLLSSVDSPFFGAFAEQWQALNPVPDPLPFARLLMSCKNFRLRI